MHNLLYYISGKIYKVSREVVSCGATKNQVFKLAQAVKETLAALRMKDLIAKNTLALVQTLFLLLLNKEE